MPSNTALIISIDNLFLPPPLPTTFENSPLSSIQGSILLNDSLHCKLATASHHGHSCPFLNVKDCFQKQRFAKGKTCKFKRYYRLNIGTDAIAKKYTSLYIFYLRVCKANTLLIRTTAILAQKRTSVYIFELQVCKQTCYCIEPAASVPLLIR